MSNLLERWVALLAPFNFSERFVRWSFMTGISALIENRVYMDNMGGGVIYPTLYTLLVGAPATFKTTTCDRVIYDLLKPISNETEGPFWGPSIGTPAAMIKMFNEHNQRNSSNNYLSSPMFVYAGEFNTFYRDIGGGEMTTDLLMYYDPIPPGERRIKATVKDGKKEIVSPALTILGCSTMKNIVDSKMLSASGTGIVSRFIFVYEPNRPRGTRIRSQIQNRQELRALQNELLLIRSLRGSFAVSPDADELLGDLTEMDQQWHQDNPADILFAHYMARRGTQLRKLSMLFSLITRKTMVIERSDVELANAMLTAIEPDMPQAFGAQIQFQDSGLLMKLMDRIPPQGISEDELFKLFFRDGQGLTKNPEYFQALEGLRAMGWIDSVTNKKTGAIIHRRTKGSTK